MKRVPGSPRLSPSHTRAAAATFERLPNPRHARVLSALRAEDSAASSPSTPTGTRSRSRSKSRTPSRSKSRTPSRSRSRSLTPSGSRSPSRSRSRSRSPSPRGRGGRSVGLTTSSSGDHLGVTGQHIDSATTGHVHASLRSVVQKVVLLGHFKRNVRPDRFLEELDKHKPDELRVARDSPDSESSAVGSPSPVPSPRSGSDEDYFGHSYPEGLGSDEDWDEHEFVTSSEDDDDDDDGGAQPSGREVFEYADVLGIDRGIDHDLLWIAREALQNPVPPGWKVCRKLGTIYFLNTETNRCQFHDPGDAYYRELYLKHKREKLSRLLQPPADSDTWKLDVSGIDDFIVEVVTDNLKPHIRHLSLVQNLLTDAGVTHLCDALRSKDHKLESLDLSGNEDVSHEGMQAVGDLLDVDRTLQTLRLAYLHLDDDGAKALAIGLSTNTSLRHLDLSHNALSASGLAILTEAVASSCVEQVDLADNLDLDDDIIRASRIQIKLQANRIGNLHPVPEMVREDSTDAEDASPVPQSPPCIARTPPARLSHLSLPQRSRPPPLQLGLTAPVARQVGGSTPLTPYTPASPFSSEDDHSPSVFSDEHSPAPIEPSRAKKLWHGFTSLARKVGRESLERKRSVETVKEEETVVVVEEDEQAVQEDVAKVVEEEEEQPALQLKVEDVDEASAADDDGTPLPRQRSRPALAKLTIPQPQSVAAPGSPLTPGASPRPELFRRVVSALARRKKSAVDHMREAARKVIDRERERKQEVLERKGRERETKLVLELHRANDVSPPQLQASPRHTPSPTVSIGSPLMAVPESNVVSIGMGLVSAPSPLKMAQEQHEERAESVSDGPTTPLSSTRSEPYSPQAGPFSLPQVIVDSVPEDSVHMRTQSEALPQRRLHSSSDSLPASLKLDKATKRKKGKRKRKPLPAIVDGNVIEWIRGQRLGVGANAAVFMGMDKRTGRIMAVKQVRLKKRGGGARAADAFRTLTELLEREISIHSELKHPNIVELICVERRKRKVNILMEFVEGNSLETVIDQFGGRLPREIIKTYVRQMAQALAYCHARNIVHRDIKGKNVLVAKNGTVKLSDFGSAKRFASDASKETPVSPTFQYTPLWAAPEIVVDECVYSSKYDVWSLGCVIIEMATGKPPWADRQWVSPVAVLGHLAGSNETPKIPDKLEPEGQDFVRCCLQREPSKRWSCAQLLEHPWLKEDSSSEEESTSDEEEM